MKKTYILLLTISIIWATFTKNACAGIDEPGRTTLHIIKKWAQNYSIHALYSLFHKNHDAPSFATLKDLEEHVRALEAQSLNNLQIVFSIPASEWQACLETTNRLKKILMTKLQDPHPLYNHSPAIEPDFLKRIYVHLKKYNIHPQALTIVPCTTQNIFATAKGPTFDSPAILSLNMKKLHELSYDEQEYVIIHEITHLLEGHSYTKIIEEIIEKYNTSTQTSALEHPAFIEYCKMQELIADILLSINNPTIARTVFSAIQKRYLKNGDNADAIHPSPAHTYAWIHAILDCHEKQSAKNC